MTKNFKSNRITIFALLLISGFICVTLVVLFFGTNVYSLLWGTVLAEQDPPFFLVAWFIWLADRYFKEKSNTLIIGEGFGLMYLNRPTDLISIIPVMIWPLTIPRRKLKDELGISSNAKRRFSYQQA